MGDINKQLLAVGIFLLTINLVAFFVMYLDKVRSRKKGAERIPEGLMFFSAAAFGSIGVFLGMFVFHHKTAKWYFLVGIPLLIAQNSATLFFVYNLWFGRI